MLDFSSGTGSDGHLRRARLLYTADACKELVILSREIEMRGEGKEVWDRKVARFGEALRFFIREARIYEGDGWTEEECRIPELVLADLAQAQGAHGRIGMRGGE